MSTPSQPERRAATRRSALKAGMGFALGAGLLGAAPGAAAARDRSAPGRPAARLLQSGAPLCEQPGDSASAQGLGSGDLAIPYYREHDNTWGYVFGDAFGGIAQADPYLGSPVILNQAGFDASGASPISFTWALPTGARPASASTTRTRRTTGTASRSPASPTTASSSAAARTSSTPRWPCGTTSRPGTTVR